MFLALLSSMNLSNIDLNNKRHTRIENFKSEFNLIEQVDITRTIKASNTPSKNSDSNFYLSKGLANFYNENVENILKSFNFKLSDEYISFIKDGMKLEISLTVNLDVITTNDQYLNNKYDLTFYLSNDSFINQSSQNTTWKNIRYQTIDKNIADYIDTNNHWQFSFNKDLYLFNLRHVFNKKHNFRFTDFNNLHSFNSLKYSINNIKYRFFTPISLYKTIKEFDFNINKNNVDINDIKKQIYLQQTNFKNSEFYKQNKVLWDGLYDNLKLEHQQEKKLKRFIWDDKVNLKITLPIKQKYKKYLKDIYFITKYFKKIDLNWLIEVDELLVSKDDLKNINKLFPDLNLLFLTALETEVKNNLLIIKPKQEYQNKFYNQKEIRLNFKNENITKIKEENSISNNSNILNQNQQLDTKNNSTTLTNNSNLNKLIYKNPYLYISIAIILLVLICLLFLLNKIIAKSLNKKSKST
ncbi:hypothetical protein [Mycoplasma capricolum]|uniref:Membrane protein n=1 Tax=Mycoplasma capricolum subsp. capricolum TaxID=40479 RepID=A0A0C2VF40_MYCCA|nr:hypothetical protein [Mycoplasma capricolum]KIM13533.1 membrane protein [Mycoplasma capricolum subsp. capricolum]